jgi:hypothetical protein
MTTNFLGGVSILTSGFSPITLFTNNEQGAWYDPSDITTLFQDTAGTTPVTAAGQSVGLMLDKSGRGNHATQANLAQRPIYAREPLTGRRNALTFTEDFSNAVWVRTNTTVTQVAGEVWELNEGTGEGEHVILQVALSGTFPTGTAIDVKAGNASPWVRLTLRNTFLAPFIDFNLSTLQTITNVANATNPVFAATPLEDGWFRLSIRHNGAAANTSNRHLALCILGTGGELSHTGTNRTILIRRPQREPGNVITAYQRVGNNFDVTEAGVPELQYLAFDGSDDGMVTGDIVPGTDKAQVFAGVRKLSDALVGAVVGTSDNPVAGNAANPTNPGALEIRGPNADTLTTWAWLVQGTLRTAQAVTSPAPVTNVIYGEGDIAAPLNRITLDTGTTNSSTGTLGTGNFLTYPLFLGRRGNGTAAFNGRIYGVIVRFGAPLSAATALSTRQFMAAKTGVTIP